MTGSRFCSTRKATTAKIDMDLFTIQVVPPTVRPSDHGTLAMGRFMNQYLQPSKYSSSWWVLPETVVSLFVKTIRWWLLLQTVCVWGGGVVDSNSAVEVKRQKQEH